MEKNQVRDRRKYIRFPVQLIARYSEENEEEWHECSAINISREGMGINVYTFREIPLGTAIRMEIIVPVKSDPIYLWGALVWLKEIKRNPKFNYLGGVKVTTIDSDDKWALLDYAYEEWDWKEP